MLYTYLSLTGSRGCKIKYELPNGFYDLNISNLFGVSEMIIYQKKIIISQ